MKNVYNCVVLNPRVSKDNRTLHKLGRLQRFWRVHSSLQTNTCIFRCPIFLKIVSISETCIAFMYHTEKQTWSILLAQNTHSLTKSRTLSTRVWRQGYILLRVMQVKNGFLLEEKSSMWTNIKNCEFSNNDFNNTALLVFAERFRILEQKVTQRSKYYIDISPKYLKGFVF